MPETSSVPTWLDRSAAYAWRLLVVAGATALVGFVLVRLHLVVIPAVVAVILATIFVPGVEWLARRGVPWTAATVVVVVSGLLLFLGITALAIGSFVEAVPDLGDTLSKSRETITQWLGESPLNLDPKQVNDLIGRGVEQMRGSAGSIASGVLSGTMVVIEVVGGSLLALVLTFFFVRDGKGIVDWAVGLFPEEERDNIREIGQRAWSVLGRYVRGVAIIAAVDAAGIGLGLALVGVPLALPLTILVFFGGFIPLVGATLTGAVAVLVALVNGGFVDAVLVLAIILVVQQVDGNVLQPVVMGREVPLHPVMILLALGAGGILFGIAGAALAVPVAAVISAVGHELRVRYD